MDILTWYSESLRGVTLHYQQCFLFDLNVTCRWQVLVFLFEGCNCLFNVFDGRALLDDFLHFLHVVESNIVDLHERYAALGREGLADQSRRPQVSPARTEATLEQTVVALRGEHPAWGARKISRRLKDLLVQRFLMHFYIKNLFY